jgi:hypothetical protein
MRHSIIALTGSALLLYLVGILNAGELRESGKWVSLRQQDFAQPRYRQGLDDLLITKTESGDVQAKADLPASIVSNVQRYVAITLPEVEIRESSAAEVVYGLLSLPDAQRVEVCMRNVLPASKKEKPTLPAWVDACDLANTRVSVAKATGIPFLELVCRVAAALELDVGIVDSGTMILGRRGKWLPTYKPTYTLQLKTDKGEHVTPNAGAQPRMPAGTENQK